MESPPTVECGRAKDDLNTVGDTDQQAVIEFLSHPSAYGLSKDRAVERIDTHAAIVFLAGERAFKLKRAVRFSYLDFSTIDRRAASCRQELALNRRTAPELYLAVRSINLLPDGRLAFDGAGATLDWVVVMQRFDERGLFDRLAGRGGLSDSLMRASSEAVAAFHEAAERVPGFGGSAAIDAAIEGNERNLALASPGLFAAAEIEALSRQSRAALGRLGGLFERRRLAGKVRRCHGDLHLRNICLWQGRPLLFDCIEFSDDLSCIDVLYDLAFLLMDLRHRDLGGFANAVLNAYLDRTDETDGLAALPLLLSLRAAIRAHVGGAAAAAQQSAEAAQALRCEAQAYLRMARDLLRPPPPRLVAIGGLSGTGKSTLARGLAPDLGPVPGARLLHSDMIRKQLFGVAATERLPPSAYAAEVSDRVYGIMRERAVATLRAGHGVIADAVFARPAERQAIVDAARDAGAAFLGLWLAAPVETLRSRMAARHDDISDATVSVLEAQLGYGLGAIDWPMIDAAGDPEECRKQALARLAPDDGETRVAQPPTVDE